MTTTPDLVTSLAARWSDAVQQWSDDSLALWKEWAPRAWADYPALAPARGRSPGRDCGCGACQDCDDCTCCVPDADVVLNARAGERRVVAVVLHNRWRRRREVALEVGPWHRCSGDELGLKAAFTAEAVTLEPCEDRTVRLVVSVEPGAGAEERLGDVARCSSAYTDVRFEGCAKPVRLGVVVRPASCDPVAVTCDCGCC